MLYTNIYQQLKFEDGGSYCFTNSIQYTRNARRAEGFNHGFSLENTARRKLL